MHRSKRDVELEQLVGDAMHIIRFDQGCSEIFALKLQEHLGVARFVRRHDLVPKICSSGKALELQTGALPKGLPDASTDLAIPLLPQIRLSAVGAVMALNDLSRWCLWK